MLNFSALPGCYLPGFQGEGRLAGGRGGAAGS